jgi:hypothetical protein
MLQIEINKKTIYIYITIDLVFTIAVLIIANEQRQQNFTRQITSTKDLNWGTWELQTYVMYTMEPQFKSWI